MKYKETQQSYRNKLTPKVIYNKGGTVDLSMKRFKREHTPAEVEQYKVDAWKLVRE